MVCSSMRQHGGAYPIPVSVTVKRYVVACNYTNAIHISQSDQLT